MTIVGACVAGVTLSASAQEQFPTEPIELIVPTPPGGGTDITARLIAEQVEPFLGVKVVVVNRPGASGSVGVTQLTQEKPDGYTLAYVWNAPLTIVPHTLDVPYDVESYTPISQSTGGTPLIFCVKPDFPADSGEEFVEHLKANPDTYSYGNDGVGATVQLAGERVFQPLGIKLRAVPFGGAGETLQAFLGGHVDIYGGSIPPIAGHVAEGEAKCLLATSDERNQALPDAISTTELGLQGKATELWRGVLAPNGVPEDRLQILEDAFMQAAQTEKFQTFIDERGEAAIGSTGAEFKELIVSEHKDFGAIVEGLGLSPQ
jgi:tripartite-type tricarboxylate transporter receptor subunit TctC